MLSLPILGSIIGEDSKTIVLMSCSWFSSREYAIDSALHLGHRLLVDTIRSVINQLFDIMNYSTKLDNVHSIGEMRTVIGGVHFSGILPIR